MTPTRKNGKTTTPGPGTAWSDEMVRRMPPHVREIMERVSASAGGVPIETVVDVVIAWEFNCKAIMTPTLRRPAIDEVRE